MDTIMVGTMKDLAARVCKGSSTGLNLHCRRIIADSLGCEGMIPQFQAVDVLRYSVGCTTALVDMLEVELTGKLLDWIGRNHGVPIEVMMREALGLSETFRTDPPKEEPALCFHKLFDRFDEMFGLSKLRDRPAENECPLLQWERGENQGTGRAEYKAWTPALESEPGRMLKFLIGYSGSHWYISRSDSGLLRRLDKLQKDHPFDKKEAAQNFCQAIYAIAYKKQLRNEPPAEEPTPERHPAATGKQGVMLLNAESALPTLEVSPPELVAPDLEGNQLEWIEHECVIPGQRAYYAKSALSKSPRHYRITQSVTLWNVERSDYELIGHLPKDRRATKFLDPRDAMAFCQDVEQERLSVGTPHTRAEACTTQPTLRPPPEPVAPDLEAKPIGWCDPDRPFPKGTVLIGAYAGHWFRVTGYNPGNGGLYVEVHGHHEESTLVIDWNGELGRDLKIVKVILPHARRCLDCDFRDAHGGPGGSGCTCTPKGPQWSGWKPAKHLWPTPEAAPLKIMMVGADYEVTEMELVEGWLVRVIGYELWKTEPVVDKESGMFMDRSLILEQWKPEAFEALYSFRRQECDCVPIHVRIEIPQLKPEPVAPVAELEPLRWEEREDHENKMQGGNILHWKQYNAVSVAVQSDGRALFYRVTASGNKWRIKLSDDVLVEHLSKEDRWQPFVSPGAAKMFCQELEQKAFEAKQKPEPSE